MLKRLLNTPERITYQRLSELCKRHSAQVHAKIRLADVLPIEGSGISDELFAFALQSHYDFVIADSSDLPMFAIEFDGPTHDDPEQVQRDAKKDALSRHFRFPLLRIRADDLHRSESRLDRLTDLAEGWFGKQPPNAPAPERLPDPSGSSPDTRASRPEANACPLCGAELKVKTGKYGRFLSCVRFPGCLGSCELPSPLALQPTRATPSPKTSSKQRISFYVTATCSILIIALVAAFMWAPGTNRRRQNAPVSRFTGRDLGAIANKPATTHRTNPATDGRKTAEDRATDRQLNLLNLLIERRGWETERIEAETISVLGYKRQLADLNKREASRLISAWDHR